MEVKIINNLFQDTDENLIPAYVKNQKIILQFDKTIASQKISVLNTLALRNDISFRFFSYNGSWRNLSFLSELYNIQSIVLDEPLLENIEDLNHLINLKELTIGYTFKKLTIKFLRLMNLKSVVLEGNFEGLQHVLETNKILELELWNGALENNNYLNNLRLKKLTLNNVRFSNKEFMNNIYVEDELKLLRLKWLENLEFLYTFKQLQSLELISLPQLECEINFSRFINLKKVCIGNLSGLYNIIGLEKIILDEFYLYKCKNLKNKKIIFNASTSQFMP